MSSAGKSGTGHSGQMGLWGSTSDFNSTYFLIEQFMALVRTATLVQVVKCTNKAEVSAVGFVDVLPLVNMIDGIGVATKHGTVYNLCYSRVQGGKSAIIIDPQPGDIGLAVISDRDISVIKKTKKQGNPGSRRKNDLADGIYVLGVLNAVPTQYIRFLVDGDGNPNGIEVVDALGNSFKTGTAGIVMTDKFGHIINMKSDGIAITGDVTITGKITSTQDASFGGGAQFVKLADGSNATKVKAT